MVSADCAAQPVQVDDFDAERADDQMSTRTSRLLDTTRQRPRAPEATNTAQEPRPSKTPSVTVWESRAATRRTKVGPCVLSVAAGAACGASTMSVCQSLP
jgi:hypothetical protein